MAEFTRRMALKYALISASACTAFLGGEGVAQAHHRRNHKGGSTPTLALPGAPVLTVMFA